MKVWRGMVPIARQVFFAFTGGTSATAASVWNSKSPGVETACLAPERISRKTCNSAGRGAPKRRPHASEPNPTTQERLPSRSRDSTARTSVARSRQKERRVARLSEPGLSVATWKIAARVSGAATACARTGNLPAADVLIGSVSIGCHRGWSPQISPSKNAALDSRLKLRPASLPSGANAVIPSPPQAAPSKINHPSRSLTTILGIQERPLSVASPEVGEDDHTCNRCVRAP
jgi:hypothetical protein